MRRYVAASVPVLPDHLQELQELHHHELQLQGLHHQLQELREDAQRARQEAADARTTTAAAQAAACPQAGAKKLQKPQLAYFTQTKDAQARLTLIIDKVLQARTSDGQDKTVFHPKCKNMICGEVAQDINDAEPRSSDTKAMLFSDSVTAQKVHLTADMIDYVWTKVVKTSMDVENPASDPRNTGENGSAAPLDTKILARYWQVKQMKMRVDREAQVSFLARCQ